MKTRTYEVIGMSCEHCRASVKGHVDTIPGVAQADVDLESGALTVIGSDFADEQVAGAVEEAGYTVAVKS